MYRYLTEQYEKTRKGEKMGFDYLLQYNSIAMPVMALTVFIINIVLFKIFMPSEKNWLGIIFSSLIAFSCAFEMLSVYLAGIVHTDIIRLITVMSFAAYIAAAYILFLYSTVFIKATVTGTKASKIIFFIPCLAVAISGCLFGFSDINVIDGSLYIPTDFIISKAVAVIFYGIIMTIAIAVEWKKTRLKTQRMYYLAFLCLFAIPTVYSVLSVFFRLPADMSWLPYQISEYLMLIIIINLRVTNDKITDVKNRTAFDTDLINKISHTERYQKGLYLAFADCDNFTDINKIHGHNVGNMALRCIANICAETAELVHVAIYRTGGDEFGFIFVNHEPFQIDDFFNTVNYRLARNDYGFKIHLTYGVTRYEEGMTVSQFLKATDNKMLEAKAALKADRK